MSNKGQWVKLGEVLRHRKEFITIDDLVTYKRPRVQLHAQGIVLRDEIQGAFIKTKKQQICKAGDFLVAEIDAKVGGIGIIPEYLDGSIVSSHYFLFDIDQSRLDRDFLNYFIRTPAFRDQVEAQGSTNYASIRPAHVYGYLIPLPPLSEQKRIVFQINELAAEISEIRAIREEQGKFVHQMLLAIFADIIKNSPQKLMRNVAPVVRRPVEVVTTKLYPELGIRSFGNGTFHKPALSGLELGGKRIFKIETGDLLFSNVFAWEGAIAVARDEDDGRFGSHRFITCITKEGEATARFLCFYFLTNKGMELISAASPGGAGRNRTLGLEALGNICVPIPPYESQLWFDSLQAEVDQVKRLETEIVNELDALLLTILDSTFKRGN